MSQAAASPRSGAALVIAAHGASRCALQEEPACMHANALRARSLFARVEAGFWKREPDLRTVVSHCTESRVFIVPLFISGGYFADRIIPSALGFDPATAADWGRVQCKGSQLLYYSRPVGSHPAMAEVILARAREALSRDFSIGDAAKTALVIAGHGTEKHAGSKEAILLQAERIRGRGLFAQVQAAFLEQAPRIDCIQAWIDTPDVVVVPFFIGEGGHVTEDIPVMLGAAEKEVQARLRSGQRAWHNPSEVHGKRIYYAESVGGEPLLADVILARVQECRLLDS